MTQKSNRLQQYYNYSPDDRASFKRQTQTPDQNVYSGDSILDSTQVPERVRFRLCVLTYRCLNGTAPHYLAETIRPVSSRGTRHRLRSAETSTLLVPSTRRSTLGDRSFPVAAARAWNVLPQRVRDASSLSLIHI